MGLETGGTCLDVGVDPVRLVGERLAGVEAALASLDALRRQLTHIQGELAAARTPDVSTPIGALGAMRGAGQGRTEALRTAGVAPADLRVRKPAARMDELSSLFNGGDGGISAGVRAAWRDDPAAMSGDPTAPPDAWRDLTAYLERARTTA